MKDFIAQALVVVLWAGYVFGPIFGLYAAVVNSSFVNALLSIFVPWYGFLYWLAS